MSIQLEEDSNNSDNETNEDLISERIVNLLTNVVRNQYCSYLEKILGKNFETWCYKNIGSRESPPDVLDWIKKCVQLYENEALKSCMIAQFYRKSMLKIMDNIRKSTINGKLAEKLKLYSEGSDINLPVNILPITKNVTVQTHSIRLKTVATQTESPTIENRNIQNSIQENTVDTSSGDHYATLLLDEKIELFKKRVMNLSPSTSLKRSGSPFDLSIRSSKIANKNENNKKPISIINSNETKHNEGRVQSKDDDIAKELDKIFRDEETDLDDIFKISTIQDDPKINSILKEIEHSETAQNDKQQQNNMERTKDQILSKVKPKRENRLCESIWPCELHMQMQNLRSILSETGTVLGMRFNEKIKLKFIELFGEEDDETDGSNDFGPYSPSVEIDDVLLSSCKVRIAPWIVKHLMVPMNNGQIANRIVFKYFAKKMANKIVKQNQYPCEDDIKDEISAYFSNHNIINCIDDINISN